MENDQQIMSSVQPGQPGAGLPLAGDMVGQGALEEEGNGAPEWLALGAETAPVPERWVDAVHVTDVYIPQIKFMFPEGWRAQDRRAALCVFPGGGYSYLALHKEGTDVARWAAQQGMVGVALKYRVSASDDALGHFPGPLLDAYRTLSLLRTQAPRLGIDPDRVAVMGFSAGAHLAALTATLRPQDLRLEPTLRPHGNARLWEEAASYPASLVRPNAALLIYPVVSMETGITHPGTRRKILGEAPHPQVEHWCSAEKNVTPQTPPLFLVQALDDMVSPRNSEVMERACRQMGVPVQRITYPRGGHGYGMERRGNPTDAWPQEAARFLKTL